VAVGELRRELFENGTERDRLTMIVRGELLQPQGLDELVLYVVPVKSSD
jgi:hypothetical protein